MKKDLTAAGLILGVGLGGFLDGIILHQILQVHSMLSAKLPQDLLVNVKVSMIWDGFFHLFTWVFTLLGVILLFRLQRRYRQVSGRALAWFSIAGWGLFNLVEGLLDHIIFNVHHVIEKKGQSAADYLFLLSGLIFLLGGWAMGRKRLKKGPRLKIPVSQE